MFLGGSFSWQLYVNSSKANSYHFKDDFDQIINKLDAADGVVLASPTYWYSVTSDMKRFIDRSYSLIQFPASSKQWISKYQGAKKSLCYSSCL